LGETPVKKKKGSNTTISKNSKGPIQSMEGEYGETRIDSKIKRLAKEGEVNGKGKLRYSKKNVDLRRKQESKTGKYSRRDGEIIARMRRKYGEAMAVGGGRRERWTSGQRTPLVREQKLRTKIIVRREKRGSSYRCLEKGSHREESKKGGRPMNKTSTSCLRGG